MQFWTILHGRLNITHCVMSKRKLKYLVTGGYVSGWNDPRMMTLDGEYATSIAMSKCSP